MADALPENVRTHIIAKSSHAHSALMKESMVNWQNSNNLVRLTTVRQLDELDMAEARAVDKVLQLPTVEV
jgi:hypothetical protein